MTLIQDAPQNVKVAAVVAFYMTSALIVRLSVSLPSKVGADCCVSARRRWFSCKSPLEPRFLTIQTWRTDRNTVS